MKLFRREPSADDSLVSVATARGWVEAARSGQAMLPPSHVDGDPHDLNSRRPPGCGGRAHERAAIFSWNLMAHRGTERWHTLFAAAEAFERLLGRLAAN
jgi:hypothetical protein